MIKPVLLLSLFSLTTGACMFDGGGTHSTDADSTSSLDAGARTPASLNPQDLALDAGARAPASPDGRVSSQASTDSGYQPLSSNGCNWPPAAGEVHPADTNCRVSAGGAWGLCWLAAGGESHCCRGCWYAQAFVCAPGDQAVACGHNGEVCVRLPVGATCR